MGRDFQALQELIALISSGKLKWGQILNPGEKGTSKVEAFLEGIRSRKLTSDEEAAAYFYNGDKNASSYQKLKQTLFKRLLNTVFLLELDDSSRSDRQQAYDECYKEWAAAKLLLGRNATISGIRLCEKVLRKAQRFEFTELSMQILRVLRTHYGSREGDSRKFHRYKKLYRETQALYLMEDEAEEKYTELILQQINSKAVSKKLTNKAKRYNEALQPYLKQHDSYHLELCSGLIQLIVHTTTNDFQNTLDVCDHLIDVFEKKPYTASVPLQVAYYQKLICHTQLKQYDEGKEMAEKCLSLLQEGSFNWFKYQELFLILLLHTKKYQEAYRVFLQTVQHRRFKILSPANQETWKIFEGFIHYLIDIGRIEADEGDQHFNKFRLGRFLNETPIFSRDKRGMNIPILIIQILFMIQQNKFDQAIDRIEAIEKYSTRYLRKNDTFRSNCFIKMLLQIPKSGFHRAAVVRKAEKYRERLDSMPINLTNQPYEIEVIPYEDLWEMVLETLDNQFH